ncbi:type II secretion system minor pseudopilin GspI [Hyphococcus lacteus]|uniref:Type II secretion system protein I n=1 Tax=Hyphococcus lacteus TaxID=3143536 RepID=A0ABV3Z6Z1_9PROT
MTRANQQRGVSLVETLVALSIMGFVVASLLALIGQNTRFISSLEDRNRGMIAADNLMVEALILPEAIQLGTKEGETIVGGEALRYFRTTTETGVDDVVRIDINISPMDSDQIIARATSMRRVQ